MAVIWLTRNTLLSQLVNDREKEERERQQMATHENPTCNHCQEPIYDKSSFEQNGKTVHWKCVRTIVMERLEQDDRGALEQFAEKINQTAEEFAKRLGFQSYDEYHKDTYGY